MKRLRSLQMTCLIKLYHSTSDLIHSKLIDLLSQFNAPRYALKKNLDLMKEAHLEGFDFLTDHPSLTAVMNRMSRKFPAVPKPKKSIVSLERDDAGEEMNPQMRTALERRQWDKIAVHHFDYEQTIKPSNSIMPKMRFLGISKILMWIQLTHLVDSSLPD